MTGDWLRPRRAVPWALFLVAFLGGWPAAVPAARADAPSVTASLSEQATEVGQPVQYRIEVSGGRVLTRLRAPQVDGLNVVSSSQSTNLQFNNFSLQESVVYTFTIYPTRTGTFTIPEQEIQVGASVLRTRPLTLTVSAGGGGGNRRGGSSGGAGGGDPNAPDRIVRAEIIVSKKTAYVGEPIPVELRLIIGRQARLREADPNPQFAGEGFSVGRFAQPTGTTAVVDGAPVQIVTYKTVITAAKTGKLNLGPAEVTPIVHLPTRRPRMRGFGGFDDDLFDNFPSALFSPAQQVKTTAAAVPIEILPLPTAGQPADFTGAVGRFEMLPPEVEPRTGVAGDPLTVRLAVRGRGSFDRLGVPVPASEEGLRFYPPTDRFQADDDVGLGGTKTFEQSVIAQGPRDHLPGYHFSYFDPVAARYVTLQTPPIPVKITPGAAATPPPPAPVMAAAPPVTAVSPTPPPPAAAAAKPEDILYIRPDFGPPAAPDAFLPTVRRRGFWLAQLLPMTTLAALLIALRARARARDEAARQRAAQIRQREELLRALRSEQTGRRDFYDAAARLLALNADGPRTPGDDLPPEVETILQRHGELAYSGSAADTEPVPGEERRGVLAALGGLEKR